MDISHIQIEKTKKRRQRVSRHKEKQRVTIKPDSRIQKLETDTFTKLRNFNKEGIS